MIAWRRCVKAAKTRYGYPSIPYFAVFEATQLGQPHLHVLCRLKWIDQRWLSDFMRAAIDAPIVDIRRCTSGRAAARYVSKYLGKAPNKFGTSKRYWCTKDYVHAPATRAQDEGFRGGKWEVIHQSINDLLLHHTIHRHKCTKVGPIWVIATRAPP